MRIARRWAIMAAAILGGAGAVRADLIGTDVIGSLVFNGINWFDPANGMVPPGPLNNAGTTVTVSATAVEFGFRQGANNHDTADFTATQLILTDVSGVGSISITYTFTDSAFAGLAANIVSNDIGATVSLAGDVLAVVTPVFFTPGTTGVTLSLTPVPEPSSIALCGLGLVAVAAYSRRRRASKV